MTPWITAEELLTWAPGVSAEADEADMLDTCIEVASALAYEISGRQFPGSASRTVRPCNQDCGCWTSKSSGFSYWSWTQGDIGAGWGWGNECGDRCGCGSLSIVRLAGPVTAITTVKIDGVVVDPTHYRLDRQTDLVYLSDTATSPPTPREWPGCQDLSLPDTQAGTFSVKYDWGLAPPQIGKIAAATLAGEVWKSLNNRDCKLPARTVKIVRQGVTMDKVVPIADTLRQGSTGMPMVDLFIANSNPTKMSRRPAVWSPDVQPFAREVG